MEINNKKVLVAYFSRPGENYSNGRIVNLSTGNTEVVAKYIKELTGGDIFKIDTVKDYPVNYSQCTDIAQVELNQNARPKLSSDIDISDYDVIYLGYPNWWGTMPMAVFTFLEQHDLSGKTIMPFCTHEGSGMGRSESDLKKLSPNSKIIKGLAIHGSRIKESKKVVENWIKKEEN